jgi:hypothetical protein
MPSAADDPAQKPGVARQARAADAADAAADAAAWVEVHSELLGFKRKMLADTDSWIGGMAHAQARREVERTDAVVLRAEAERLARRLGFWRRRLQDLSNS